MRRRKMIRAHEIPMEEVDEMQRKYQCAECGWFGPFVGSAKDHRDDTGHAVKNTRTDGTIKGR